MADLDDVTPQHLETVDSNITPQNSSKTAYLPNFTMQNLVEAGIHFGHKTSRWNPKMAPYIYGTHNGIHVIDLQKTVPLLKIALQVLHNVALERGRILFVGTKLQAASIIAEAAASCSQYYVNHRWLGGMLTNWPTVSSSIRTLEEHEYMIQNEDNIFTKKEIVEFDKKRQKLERSFGGIREMGGMPNILFIIDTNKEHIAIKEAQKLRIPIVAVLDTNSDPAGITYPIPGNDDAKRSIELYCKLASEAILAGIESDLAKSGVRIDDIKDGKFERKYKAEEQVDHVPLAKKSKFNSEGKRDDVSQEKYRNKNFGE